jgi:hypothetical protein
MEVGRVGGSGIERQRIVDEFQKLRAHQREAVPAPPPVDRSGDARTVLAGKDSLRRADARPCLLRSVPADFDLRRAAPAGTSRTLVLDKKMLTAPAFSWKWRVIRPRHLKLQPRRPR